MTSNLQADHNSNFKQNIFNEIDNGRKLYKENKNPKVRYLSLEKKINDDDEFFNVFERDIDDFKTTKNYYNRNKFQFTKLPSIFENNSKVKYAQEILEEKEIFAKNDVLRKNIAKLKEMHLIQDKNIKIKSFKSSGKSDFVYNDFHLRATNPGFSRNKLGSFFTK